ncbi:MAG: HpcH/HpaI aldolase/citrate lyase family protein [Anaerolineae bacterium]
MLFTPGNNMRMIQKAGTLGADAIILDLEDAVPMADKETARIFVRDSIEDLSVKGSYLLVRINALTSGLAEQDLEWVVQKGLVGIVLPKVESRDDVLEIARLIDQQEKKGIEPASQLLIPILETAKGVLNAHEIATASQRVIAIAFGAIDFARDMGISLSREGTELLYARSRVAISARAAGVQAIDTPWIDIADEEGLVQEAKMARQLGFRGKLLIHPSQIEPVNRVFSPSESEMEYAKKVVEAFQRAEARGLGAISLEGKMIDIANFHQAEELIALAETIAQKERR